MNQTPFHMTDELLAAYVAGACTPAQRQEVERWLAEAPQNRKELDQAIAVWEMAINSQPAMSMADINKAWEKQKALQQQQQHVHKRSNTRIIWGIAASLVLLVALALVWRLSLTAKQATPPLALVQLTTAGETITDTLPDGSVVTLNTLSAMDYPASFADTVRRVRLQGEAFFTVAKDATKPFVIEANGVEIRVLGTAFNVKTSQAGTQVLVEEGKVRVTNRRETVTLTAGQKLQATDSSRMEAEPVTNQLYQYYRTEVFVCDNTPLTQLADVLSDAYGVSIRLGSSRVQNLRLSTTFQQESLDTILNIIALTFDIAVSREGDTIWLR